VESQANELHARTIALGDPIAASAPIGHASEYKLVLALIQPPGGVAASHADKRSKEVSAFACPIKTGKEALRSKIGSAMLGARTLFRLAEPSLSFFFLNTFSFFMLLFCFRKRSPRVQENLLKCKAVFTFKK
jgi:hypothetical protein